VYAFVAFVHVSELHDRGRLFDTRVSTVRGVADYYLIVINIAFPIRLTIAIFLCIYFSYMFISFLYVYKRFFRSGCHLIGVAPRADLMQPISR